jgi:hypothetical protein
VERRWSRAYRDRPAPLSLSGDAQPARAREPTLVGRPAPPGGGSATTFRVRAAARRALAAW